MRISTFAVWSLSAGLAGWAQSAEQRLKSATDIFSNTLSDPGKGIPKDVLDNTQCVVVVPGIKKSGFLMREQNGKGFAFCRQRTGGWSAPAAVQWQGGNLSNQAGVSETDALMLFMKRGADQLFSNKYTLGRDASVAAGPIGTTLDTDSALNGDILGYSRVGGLFAGSTLAGATLRPDPAGNKELYGDANLTSQQIIRDKVPTPIAAQPLRAELIRKFGNVSTYGETSARPPSPPPPPQPVADKPSLSTATWNTWIEESTGGPPTFDALETMAPNNEYTLVVDLSAFMYGKSEEGVSSQQAGNRLMDWLKKQDQKPNGVSLHAVLIPDPGYFLSTPERAKPILIHLDKMRAFLDKNQARPQNPLAFLKTAPDPPFQFGRVSFTISTGSNEGLGFLGVSLWADGIIPLDEISIPVCISKAGKTDQCDRVGESTRSRSHGDPLNAAPLTSESDLPAAAFHFIEFNGTRGVGVFRRNDWPDGQYETWGMNRLSEGLASITATLLKNFEKETSDDALAQTGSELYNLLVPVGADSARRAFESFVASRVMALSVSPAQPPPQILVRIAPLDPASSFALPLAMITVSVDGTNRFIGDLFRILSPLPAQDYRPVQACIARWVMVMPPDDPRSPPELLAARREFQPWANACKGSDCMSTLEAFAKWIKEPKPEEPDPTALLLLSHYENQSLTFDHAAYFSPLTVGKSFAQPSLAIINACGAAAPGADFLVRKLNGAGFQTVIATNTTVSAIMAGKYFNLLAKSLEDNRNTPGYTVSRAHFDAVQRLKSQSLPQPNQKPFGAKALIYSLLGNGSLSLCPLTPTN